MGGTELVHWSVAAYRFGGFGTNYVGSVLLLLALTLAPYLCATLPTVAYVGRYSAALWILTIGMLLVAEASLCCRIGEQWLIEDAWRINMSGGRYMNCAPPPRFLILVLDYCGTAAVGLIAWTAFLIQHALALARDARNRSRPQDSGTRFGPG